MPKLPRLLNVNYDEDRLNGSVLTESPSKDSLPPSNMDEINESKKHRRLEEINVAFNQTIGQENEKLQEKLRKLNDFAKEVVKVFYTGD